MFVRVLDPAIIALTCDCITFQLNQCIVLVASTSLVIGQYN